MLWFKVQTAILDDGSSVWELSDGAFRLWVNAIAWAAREETGGRLWQVRVEGSGRRRLLWCSRATKGGQWQFSRPLACGKLVRSRPLRHVEELRKAGLVVDEGGVLVIRDWRLWQRDLEAAIASRPRDADRKRRARSGVDVQVDASRGRAPAHVGAKRRESRESPTGSLSTLPQTTTPAASADTNQGGTDVAASKGRAIELDPKWQQPDHDGIRPYIRDAITRYRNTGAVDYLTWAEQEDTITDREARALRDARQQQLTDAT